MLTRLSHILLMLHLVKGIPLAEDSPYAGIQVEGGKHGQGVTVGPEVVPRARVTVRPWADNVGAMGIGFVPTQDPLNRQPDVADLAQLQLRHTDSNVIRHCPINEVDRKSCGTDDRNVCGRWMCCWNVFAKVKCAQPLYTISEDGICGSSRVYNPRPRPFYDLSRNFKWLLLSGRLGGFVGRRKRDLESDDTRQNGVGIKQRIIGGNEAIPNSFPWVARMYERGKDDEVSCGGSLISDRWILTTAHCLPTNDPSIYRIALGDHDMKMVSGREQTFEISQLIIHPDYNDVDTLNNDIALMKLSTKAEINDWVSPVCLPPPDTPTDDAGVDGNFINQIGLAVGWGKTETSESSDRLLETELMILSSVICKTVAKLKPGDAKFCAGAIPTPPNLTNDTCTGDSGGPLVLYHDDQKVYVHGLTSYGLSNTCGKLPAVYTKVSKFTNWIMGVLSMY